mgnify:CR=1 FL=1
MEILPLNLALSATIQQVIGFILFFLWELVLANLRMAVTVLSPRLAIRPAVVAIPLDIRSNAEITLLANLITLTPGTLVVDIRGDSLFIHWINVTETDPVAATREIAGRFEKYLKVVYG